MPDRTPILLTVADFLTPREMMTRAATRTGRRPVILGVPVLTPRLSSFWAALA